MPILSNFSFPTDIKVGENTAKMIPDILGQHGFSRPLYVTDSFIRHLPFFTNLCQDAKKAGLSIEVFSDISGNPSAEEVEKGAKAFAEHQADSLVMIGGGAVLDVGKAIAVAATHSGSILDYAEGAREGKTISQELPFKIAVPTSAGTGSEVGRSSVISAVDTKKKWIIFSPLMLPEIVFLDPLLSTDLPLQPTIFTGIDALTHCIEAYLAKGYHPICDGIAIEGIKLISQHLPIAVKEPKNLNARLQMMVAATMGAISFQKGLGVTHSCAHALSTHFNLHHGLANALMLEACLNFNLSHCESKYLSLLGALGRSSGNASHFVRWVHDFFALIGADIFLRQIRVEVHQKLIETALEDPCHQLNPKTVSSQDFSHLFQAVFTKKKGEIS